MTVLRTVNRHNEPPLAFARCPLPSGERRFAEWNLCKKFAQVDSVLSADWRRPARTRGRLYLCTWARQVSRDSILPHIESFVGIVSSPFVSFVLMRISKHREHKGEDTQRTKFPISDLCGFK